MRVYQVAEEVSLSNRVLVQLLQDRGVDITSHMSPLSGSDEELLREIVAEIRKDPALAVVLVLSLNFVANCGGPGSPAAGGRNAVMIGILSDYGIPLSFGEWVGYGLPFVPVMALVIAAYFFLTMRGKIATGQLDIAGVVQRANEKIGPMNSKEFMTLAVLIGLVTLWITSSGTLGMGGPVILALVFQRFIIRGLTAGAVK
jgi:di/tricarboxylate transporter